MGFQRVCAPFGGGLGGKAHKSPSADGEIPASPAGVLQALLKGEF